MGAPAAMRVDKWLWAARFYKSRSLASAAAEAGKIHINGATAKPASDIKPGDQLDIHKADQRWHITVRGLSLQRGAAPQAALLYQESEESRLARETAAAQRKLAAEPAARLQGRPTKRDRRRLTRLVQG